MLQDRTLRMPKCTVVNCHCGYNGFPTPKDIRWFRAPKSQGRRDQWEFRLQRQYFKIKNDSRFCSIHFKDEDFIPECENKDTPGRKRKKRHLKSSAVPSLHMGKCKCLIHHKPEKSTQSKVPLHESTGSDLVEDAVDVKSTDFEQIEDVSEYKENFDSDPLSYNYQIHNQAQSPLKKVKKCSQFPSSSKPIGFEANEVSLPFPHSKVAESTLGQISNSMEIIGHNPWEVSDASRFLRYCCPECDFRNENLQEFSEHALENHILANTLFVHKTYNLKIGPEPELIESDLVENTVDMKSTDFEQFEDVSEIKDNSDSDPLSCNYQLHNQVSPYHEGHAQEGHIQLDHAQAGQTHSNDNDNFVQCNICNQIVNKVEFLQHVKTSHKDNDRLNNIALTSEKVLESSLKAGNLFSLVDSELFHCKFCSHTTISSRDLFSHHQENHTIKVWQIFQCESCDYHTKGKKEILDHMKNGHNIDDYKPYKCHKCDYNTPEFTNFKRHYYRHCSKGEFICTTCGATLKNKEQLTIHTLRLHTIKEKEFVCDICGFKTKMKIDLNKHKRKHQEKTLKCMYCDYCSWSKVMLDNHIDSKHQDVGGELNHMCSECGKGFIYKNSLRKHKSRPTLFHIKKPKQKSGNIIKSKENSCEQCTNLEKHSCKECGKILLTKKNLRIHLKRDHSINSHFCKICNIGFALSELFEKHNYQLHGISCPKCNKIMLNKFELRRHLDFRHGIKYGA